MIPAPVLERLSAYRRHLHSWATDGKTRIYSHELARIVGSTPAQVRRDLMTIGSTGSPAHGYAVAGLIERIGALLNPPGGTNVALIGVGHLGRAILHFFRQLHPELQIVAAFDVGAEKVGREFDGCPCHHVREMERILLQQHVLVAILAAPASAALEVTERLVRARVRGILNFTSARLRVPAGVFVEDVDLAAALDSLPR